MAKGFMIPSSRLAEEYRDAKISGRSQEMADLTLLIAERMTDEIGFNAEGKKARRTSAQEAALKKARNRQAQRRFQRKMGTLPVGLAPGDRIFDPWNHGVIIVVDSVEKQGREFWIRGKREIDGIGWTAKRTLVQLRQLARVDGPAPEPASADLSGPLAASVAIESTRSFLAALGGYEHAIVQARAFLEALDGYVAGEIDVSDFQRARTGLENSLRTADVAEYQAARAALDEALACLSQ